MKDIGIVLVTYNCSSYILDCLKSLIINNSENIGNVIVVDNDSEDDTVEIVEKNFPMIKVIKNSSNVGYAKAVNIGMNEIIEKYCLIANPDTIFKLDSLNILRQIIESDDTIAAAGGQQINDDDSWQRSYGNFPGIKDAIYNLFFITSLINLFERIKLKYFDNKKIKFVNYLDGGAILVRNSAFRDVDGFNEDYFFYAEEADFAFRLKQKNWKLVFEPSAKIFHTRGGSSSKISDKRDYFQNLLVKSKLLFVKLNCPNTNLKFFAILEWTHNIKMYLILRSLSFIFFNRNFSSKASTFRSSSKIWLDKISTLK